MSLANKIAALLTGLTRNQVEAMSPVERQQLADQCRRITALADQPPRNGEPKEGLLSNLKDTPRDE
jgi:hypothetical protein